VRDGEYTENCRKRVITNFDCNDRFLEYIDLYRDSLNTGNKYKELDKPAGS